MQEKKPTPRKAISQRLRKIMVGPASRRAAPQPEFEKTLLKAWDHPGAELPRSIRNALTRSQVAGIARVRRENGLRRSADDTTRFFLEVFHALPHPVLVTLHAGLLWNTRFAACLRHEEALQRQLPFRRRTAALQRCALLLEHSGHIHADRLLMPLGRQAWRARVVDLPAGSSRALYLSPVRLDLSSVPADARTIALYKCSGIPHKQIALLTGRSKSYVDHVSSRYRTEFQVMRNTLCPAPAP